MILLALPLAALTSCGQANGRALDPSSDLQCSVIVYYFDGLAEHVGAPTDHKRILSKVNQWYASKVQQLALERSQADSEMGQASAVLEQVKRDPEAAYDEAAACIDRAVADPAFNGFISAPR